MAKIEVCLIGSQKVCIHSLSTPNHISSGTLIVGQARQAIRKINLDTVIINDNIWLLDWHVTFYNEKVEDETLSFPKGILANLLHIIEMMLQFGPALGIPYTESI